MQATLEKPYVPIRSTFTMPIIELGQTVIYKHHRSDKGMAAIVTRVGTNNVDVLVFHEGACNGYPKNAVAHEDDPAMFTEARAKNGCWCKTKRDEALDSLGPNLELLMNLPDIQAMLSLYAEERLREAKENK